MKSKECSNCGYKSLGNVLIVVAILVCLYIFVSLIMNWVVDKKVGDIDNDGGKIIESQFPPPVVYAQLVHDDSLNGKWIEVTPGLLKQLEKDDYPRLLPNNNIKIYESRDIDGNGVNLTYEYAVPERTFKVWLREPRNSDKRLDITYQYYIGNINDSGDIRFERVTQYIYPIKRPLVFSISISPEMETTLGRQLEKKNLSDVAITYNYFKLLNPPNPFDCNGKPPWLLECCGIKNTADAYQIQIYGLYINNCRIEKERYYQVNEGNNTFFEKRIEYDLSACVNKNYSIILCDKKEEC